MANTKPPLTTRELETLNHLAEGYSDLEISKALGNKEGTVKNCLTTIRLKLAALSSKPLNKRTNLAQFYREHLVPKPDSSQE